MLSQNQFGFLKTRHLPDQVWDRYSRGDYHASEAGTLEMHLLVCPVCQAQYGKTMRGVRPPAGEAVAIQ
jgi:hypothetical protein